MVEREWIGEFSCTVWKFTLGRRLVKVARNLPE